MIKILFKAAYKNRIKDISDILNNSRCVHLVDFNSQNNRGDTLLHIAAKSESEQALELLLKLGIDPFIKNKKGKIAMEVSDKQKIKDLLKNGKYRLKNHVCLMGLNIFFACFFSSYEEIKRDSIESGWIENEGIPL